MEDQEKNPVLSPAIQPASAMPSLDAKGVARRRFTRLGVGATGVILTLHSQPGMAATNAMCVAPSGFMSVTSTSISPQEPCSYNRSHGYWKTHPEAWATRANIDFNTKFGKIFPAKGRFEALAGATLMEVLDPPAAFKGIDVNNVAMQTVTAFLNARAASHAGLPTVLPEARVMEIWKQYAAQGFYMPTSGNVIWTGAQTAEYLESTFR